MLEELGLQKATPRVVYGHITDIVGRLQEINRRSKISVATTGTITERLCEYGLRAAVPGIHHKLKVGWRWLGDFYIQGAPFNTIISVKSFKAKERLLSSGTGNVLSPSIGYGLFDELREWSAPRLGSYLFRAFFAIYMPQATLDRLPDNARRVRNINGKPFLRSVHRFTSDLRGALADGVVDPRKL